MKIEVSREELEHILIAVRDYQKGINKNRTVLNNSLGTVKGTEFEDVPGWVLELLPVGINEEGKRLDKVFQDLNSLSDKLHLVCKDYDELKDKAGY